MHNPLDVPAQYPGPGPSFLESPTPTHLTGSHSCGKICHRPSGLSSQRSRVSTMGCTEGSEQSRAGSFPLGSKGDFCLPRDHCISKHVAPSLLPQRKLHDSSLCLDPPASLLPYLHTQYSRFRPQNPRVTLGKYSPSGD